MRVKLTYFKSSGKFYADGEYNYDYPNQEVGPLFKIWDDVKEKRECHQLPGLLVGHSDYIILIDVPDHPNAHPTLLLL